MGRGRYASLPKNAPQAKGKAGCFSKRTPSKPGVTATLAPIAVSPVSVNKQ